MRHAALLPRSSGRYVNLRERGWWRLDDARAERVSEADALRDASGEAFVGAPGSGRSCNAFMLQYMRKDAECADDADDADAAAS